jgi:hypothetical protein
MRWQWSFLLAAPLLFSIAQAENAAKPQPVQLEPSTLHCLAVRWPVLGDDNENASVDVQYRKKGATDWRRALPLLRCIKEATNSQRGQWKFSKGNLDAVRVPGGHMYAGSIVDLDPETEYEVKLLLKDPDGGDTEQTLLMKTIGEPKDPPGLRERHVTTGSGGGSGSKEDPLKGLEAALAGAEPGDLFLIHAGKYDVKGALTIPKSGTEQKPIILRGAGDGETIIDGGGDDQTKGILIAGHTRKYIWIEDLTLQGREHIIVANEGSNWVLRRNKFLKMEKGFTAQNGNYNSSRGHFISDNVFIGPTSWPRTKGIENFAGICSMSGSGHVVCFNKFSNEGDGIHCTGYGNLSATDFHNNDMHVCTDDGFETDYGESNIRVYRNRIVNVAHGISTQPSQGGPMYFFRNVIFNPTYSPFKLHNDTCGVFLFHNTCLRSGPCFNIVPGGESVTQGVTRNNLFLGTGGAALNTSARFVACDFDSDGFGGFAGPFALWNGKTYKTADDAKASGALYKARGAFVIDPKTCFASGLTPPAKWETEFKNDELDFRLKEGSGAVDKGEVVPNFSDGYAGAAPDLGAVEFGQPEPHYGPRKNQ